MFDLSLCNEKKLGIARQHNINYRARSITRLNEHAAFAGRAALGRQVPKKRLQHSLKFSIRPEADIENILIYNVKAVRRK